MARSPRSYAPSTDALNSRLERASTSCSERPFCRRIARRRSPTRAPVFTTPKPPRPEHASVPPLATTARFTHPTSTLRESHASHCFQQRSPEGTICPITHTGRICGPQTGRSRRACSRTTAAAATGAVAARSTWGPRPRVGTPASERELFGREPTFGPDQHGPSRGPGRAERGGRISITVRDDETRRADERAEVDDVVDHWKPGPAATAFAASRATDAQASRRRRHRGPRPSAQPRARCGPEQSRATPSSVTLATTPSRPPFVQRDRERDGRRRLGLVLEAAARFQDDAAATRFRRSRSGATRRCRRRRPPARRRAADAPVRGDDRRRRRSRSARRACRRRQVRPRRRRETSRAGAQDLNADLMRENKPSCGGVTCSPRSAANCTSSSASSAVSRVGTSTWTSTTRSPRRPPRKRRHTESAHAHQRAVLGARWDLDLVRTVERVELDVGSERRLHDGDRQPPPEIVAAPFEVRMRRDAHDHVEVAGGTTARTGRSASGEPQPLSFVDAGRHLDVDRARAVDASGPAARQARIRHDLARGAARRGTATRS